MENIEIYEWLKKQNYQTELSNEQQYTMYFEIDMPKILNDFLDYVNYCDDEERSFH